MRNIHITNISIGYCWDDEDTDDEGVISYGDGDGRFEVRDVLEHIDFLNQLESLCKLHASGELKTGVSN